MTCVNVRYSRAFITDVRMCLSPAVDPILSTGSIWNISPVPRYTARWVDVCSPEPRYTARWVDVGVIWFSHLNHATRLDGLK